MKRIKIIVSFLLLVICMVVMSPKNVCAAEESCLSVRDNGYHDYTHRVYSQHPVYYLELATFSDGSV